MNEVIEKPPETEPELSEIIRRIHRKRSEAQHHLSRVKDSEKLQEFIEKFQKSGALGLAALIPKMGDLLPEVAPAYQAFLALNDVANMQFEVIEKLVKQVEELKGVDHVQ